MLSTRSILLILTLTASGCSAVPAYPRAQSDYWRAKYMLTHGGGRENVRSDWGEPDYIFYKDKIEVWTYAKRQDGKTFEFFFDERGQFVQMTVDSLTYKHQ